MKINALSPNGTNAFTNSRNVEICASLAVQHFNDRRVDLYPALKIVEKCSIKINVTAYCDDQAKSLVGVNLFTNLIPQLDAPIHAVSGLVVSGVAASITVLSSALGTWPVMSHWLVLVLLLLLLFCFTHLTLQKKGHKTQFYHPKACTLDLLEQLKGKTQARRVCVPNC